MAKAFQITPNGLTHIQNQPLENPALWMSDNLTTKGYIAAKVAVGEASRLVGKQRTEPARTIGIITDTDVKAGDRLDILLSGGTFMPKFKVTAVQSVSVKGKYSFGSTYWQLEVELLTPDPLPKAKAKTEPAA